LLLSTAARPVVPAIRTRDEWKSPADRGAAGSPGRAEPILASAAYGVNRATQTAVSAAHRAKQGPQRWVRGNHEDLQRRLPEARTLERGWHEFADHTAPSVAIVAPPIRGTIAEHCQRDDDRGKPEAPPMSKGPFTRPNETAPHTEPRLLRGAASGTGMHTLREQDRTGPAHRPNEDAHPETSTSPGRISRKVMPERDDLGAGWALAIMRVRGRSGGLAGEEGKREGGRNRRGRRVRAASAREQQGVLRAPQAPEGRAAFRAGGGRAEGPGGHQRARAWPIVRGVDTDAAKACRGGPWGRHAGSSCRDTFGQIGKRSSGSRAPAAASPHEAMNSGALAPDIEHLRRLVRGSATNGRKRTSQAQSADLMLVAPEADVRARISRPAS